MRKEWSELRYEQVMSIFTRIQAIPSSPLAYTNATDEVIMRPCISDI